MTPKIVRMEGEREQALSRLRIAEQNGFPFYRMLEIELTFETMREDGEFQQIVSEIKARVDKMRAEAATLDLPVLPD